MGTKALEEPNASIFRVRVPEYGDSRFHEINNV
jgi:hypothetical protein